MAKTIVPLSPLDQTTDIAFIHYVLCFSCETKHHDNALSVWVDVLRALVELHPFLNGKVISCPQRGPGHRALEYFPGPLRDDLSTMNEDGTQRVEIIKWAKRLTISYKALKDADFNPSLLRADHWEELHWLPKNPKPRDEQPVFRVQANCVENGLLLAIWFHHSVMDGAGSLFILREIGEAIEKAYGSRRIPLPAKPAAIGLQGLYDASRLCDDFEKKDADLLPETASNFKIIEGPNSLRRWAVWLQSRFSRYSHPEHVNRVLRFRESDLQRIRRPDGKTSSPFRCAVALLFMAVVRARVAKGLITKDRPPRCFVIKDMREALGLDASFIGNTAHECHFVWPDITALINGKLVDLPQALGEVLDEVCKTIKAAQNPTYMRKRIDYINHQINDLGTAPQDIKWNMDLVTTDFLCNSWEPLGTVCGTMNCGFDWMGKLQHVQRPYSITPGSMTMLPRCNNFIDVDIGLEHSQMELLMQELDGWRAQGWLVVQPHFEPEEGGYSRRRKSLEFFRGWCSGQIYTFISMVGTIFGLTLVWIWIKFLC